jgi:two-component system OmpR family sensor kinase
VTVHEEDGQAICEVHDNGPGIPAGELEQLFTPWFQGREHRSRRDGVGLGLRFVQVVAERHHGRVSVRSAPGDGTTFRLALPSLPME